MAHPIPIADIQIVFADQIQNATEEFQTETGRWLRRETKMLNGIELGNPREVPLTDADSRQRWKAQARQNPRAHLEQHDAFLRWQERLNFFNLHASEPLIITDDQLQTLVEYWTEGHDQFSSVLKTSPLAMMPNIFPQKILAQIDAEAPDHLQVPSGSWIKVQYRPNDPPILSVRLQELFGWMQAPRIAFGKQPLILELLGPNYRPIQITQDLKSFWSKTYFEIRKELRLKYPRHSWPEDPLTAVPVAKGRPRK